ncbi:MAG: hypothetical protein KGM99_18155, partial [Burkholderiales bacterium]|nr:hypothetical protein [Burkholderiales bacterium]
MIKSPMKLKALAFATLQVLLTYPAASMAAASNEVKQVAVAATLNTGMDTSVAPGDDFNRYANGAWEKNAVIPD